MNMNKQNIVILDYARLVDIFGEDTETHSHFLEKAVKNLTQLLIEIEKNVAERNSLAGKNAAHTLKGLSGNIGAIEMYEIAKTLEDHILHNNWQSAEQWLKSEQIAFITLKEFIDKKNGSP